MKRGVTVTVPATTANLGPGFDCLGAALTLNNEFQFSRLGSEAIEAVQINVTGLEADRVSQNETNLAYQAFVKLFQHLGQSPPPVQIDIHLKVPLARGLGSSATAIVAGLVGANELAGAPLSQADLINLAIALEGHPDNVVPALIGGCRLAASRHDNTWEICDIPWHPELAIVVGIPNFELSTAEARQVLPKDYSRADAIFNIAHLGLLLRGLETGDAGWLRAALQDRIHQPYRQSLILGYGDVQAAAVKAGAYGLVISGAGPTLLAIAPLDAAQEVEAAIALAWTQQNVEVETKILQLDQKGAMLHEHPSPME